MKRLALPAAGWCARAALLVSTLLPGAWGGVAVRDSMEPKSCCGAKPIFSTVTVPASTEWSLFPVRLTFALATMLAPSG